MGLSTDTQNCRLRMRREYRERFPRHRLQRKPLTSDPDMHHGPCVTHGPWCMSGSLTRGGGENVPGIPGACATRKFVYLVRGPWVMISCRLSPVRQEAIVFQCRLMVNWTPKNRNQNAKLHFQQHPIALLMWCCFQEYAFKMTFAKCRTFCPGILSRVRVTKTPFVEFSVTGNFDLSKA